eukprot:scaffold59709_cov69-Phaeocystis_antarctica.AAC.1
MYGAHRIALVDAWYNWTALPPYLGWPQASASHLRLRQIPECFSPPNGATPPLKFDSLAGISCCRTLFRNLATMSTELFLTDQFFFFEDVRGEAPRAIVVQRLEIRVKLLASGQHRECAMRRSIATHLSDNTPNVQHDNPLGIRRGPTMGGRYLAGDIVLNLERFQLHGLKTIEGVITRQVKSDRTPQRGLVDAIQRKKRNWFVTRVATSQVVSSMKVSCRDSIPRYVVCSHTV